MNRFSRLSRRWILIVGSGLIAGAALAGPLSVTPSTFDFGWAPENAKITADFTIENTGGEPVPLTGVQPTCGCTAANFTPATLASKEQKKISLTFNTRGYGGLPFSKTAKIKSENPTEEQSVMLTGHVTNPNADVSPTEDGIASFDSENSPRRRTITVSNRFQEAVALEMVQKPAEWAKLKLESKTIKGGGTGNITVSIDGSAAESRETSATFSATGATRSARFTVVVRSGTAPPAVRKSVLPSASPSASPAASPSPATPGASPASKPSR